MAFPHSPSCSPSDSFACCLPRRLRRSKIKDFKSLLQSSSSCCSNTPLNLTKVGVEACYRLLLRICYRSTLKSRLYQFHRIPSLALPWLTFLLCYQVWCSLLTTHRFHRGVSGNLRSPFSRQFYCERRLHHRCLRCLSPSS
jgi:hypothetical protein